MYRVILAVEYLGWVELRFGMLHHAALAVDGIRCGRPARGTSQISVNPTQSLNHQSHPVVEVMIN